MRGNSVDLAATYEWDNEGRMTSLAYPMSGPTLQYQYDSMGRLGTITQNVTTVASATYNGPAGQLTALAYGGVNETREYNALGQLTHISVPGRMDMQYVTRPLTPAITIKFGLIAVKRSWETKAHDSSTFSDSRAVGASGVSQRRRGHYGGLRLHSRYATSWIRVNCAEGQRTGTRHRDSDGRSWRETLRA
jgi:hypothetical protein